MRTRSSEDATVSVLDLVRLNDPNAVCIDGSQAGFYVNQSPDSKVWIVHLQGGHWCYDSASCAARCGTPNSFKTEKHSAAA